MLDILKGINWVDIFVVIILFRLGYIAIKGGLPIEIFKILGTLAATYLSLHYYQSISEGVVLWLPLVKDRPPWDLLNFISFMILAVLGYLIFVSLRMLCYRFIKMQATPKLSKWGGLFLGLLRAVLLLGLIVFALLLTDMRYYKDSVRNSYAGRGLSKVAPNVYIWIWKTIGSKFATGENFNQSVLEL
jgi:uncharacterized membrane protein required for colicin V production